jgi:hypothetical protein
MNPDGRRRVVSAMQYVELFEPQRQGERDAGYAPYLDYRPLQEEERAIRGPYP